MEFVGLFFPIIVEWLNKNMKNDDEKIIVCILTCVVAAIIIDWQIIATGDYRKLHNVLVLIILLYGESQLVFKTFWQPLIQDKFQQLIGARQQQG